MNKQKIVIIIGLTAQGLSLLRTLGKNDIPTFAFYTNKKNVGIASKYGKKQLIRNVNELKENIELLLSQFNYKPLCYITSGELLADILRNYKELYEKCIVIASPYNIVNTLAHKDLMYDLAKKKGFRVANYCTLNNYKKGQLSLPFFIKRNFEIPLFFKAVKISTQDSFDYYYNNIAKQDRKDIIVQEFIDIPPKQLYEISAQFFFSKGISKGHLISHQKRKLKKGITSYIEEINEKELSERICNLCTSFMKDLDYTGFAEFEFMYNKISKDLYFMEINTRTCGEQSSLCHKFTNISDVILNPYNAPLLEVRIKSLKWMNIIRDLRVRFEKKDFSSPLDIFHSKFDIWDIHDIKPFFKQFIR